MDDAEIRVELDRARSAYLRRDADPQFAVLYEPLSPAPLFTLQEREWLTASLLRSGGVTSLQGLDILDVGCGSGVELHRLALWGADPTRMAGIDLMDNRISAAKARLPGATLRVASAHQLPFASNSFNLVSQFTTFSSIMSPKVRRAAASEMLRVLRPDGLILWYDIRTLSRRGSDLHAIDKRELSGLFNGCEIISRPATLRWDILRRTVPISRFLGLALQRVAPLTSHCIAVIRPAAGAS